MFLEASGKGDQPDCYDELRAQEESLGMYGFLRPEFFPKLITTAMNFPINQSVAELMVRSKSSI